MKVLLAEDDPINVVATKGMLERVGHEVVVASNGKNALDMLCRQSFSVILMDDYMPVFDGISAIKAIRSDAFYANNADIPIIAVTSRTGRETRDEFIAAGADAFLAKPTELPTLLNTINEVVVFRKDATIKQLQSKVKELETILVGSPAV